MSNLTRRHVMQGAAAGAAAIMLPTHHALGANDRINLGFIGVGGKGNGAIEWFSSTTDATITWACDVDRNYVDRAKQHAEKRGHKNVRGCVDLREMLDDKDLDAVVISTCNHWHCLAAIWACQAGKDVYVEKPVSHNIWEGRKLVEAARRHNRIVQGGTQQRSDPLQQQIKDYLDAGELGAMTWVRLNRYGVRGSIGKRDTPLTPPESVDYNLWLGPAADEPILRPNLHYDWHWDWNTGNGEAGNWGPHIFDDCRNVVFRDKVPLPKRVLAGGGRFVWDDAGETPNTHFVYMDTGVVPVIFDNHNLPMSRERNTNDVYMKRKTRAFLVIECENGYYAGGRGGGAAYDASGKVIKKFNGDAGKGHAKNFIDAVRSRKREDLNGEIEQIHYSSAWCHLCNISYRLGATMKREEAAERIKGFEPWADVLDSTYAHLEANGVDPAHADLKLGTMLEIDPQRETFIGPTATSEAKALLRHEYRHGFEIGDVV